MSDSIYSNNCNPKKTLPNDTVKNSPIIAHRYLWFKILWWAQVIVTPDDNKITVFNRGIEKGSTVI